MHPRRPRLLSGRCALGSASMRTSLLALVAAAAVVVPAAPAAAKTVEYDARATVHKRSQSGTTLVYAGKVRSTHLGPGRVKQTIRLAGLNATGSFVIRYRHGKLRGTTQTTGRPRLDGTAAFSGTVRITGGTGRYAGATGSGRYTGSAPLDLSKATFRQRGTITY